MFKTLRAHKSTDVSRQYPNNRAIDQEQVPTPLLHQNSSMNSTSSWVMSSNESHSQLEQFNQILLESKLQNVLLASSLSFYTLQK